MSNFSLFMKGNKIAKPNGKYAPTSSLVDENGKPLEWEFRHLTSKENEEIRSKCTKEIPITGKLGAFRPKLNTAQYLSEMIVESTVYPDLKDAELQNSYGVMGETELLYALVDDAGEYQELTNWMQQFQGFTKGLEEQVQEAKN